ncbi:MAG TPA: heavy metal-binding domain-containing protein [Draconibacterium sp.]|nr:heavy metal-binding domain-containing protein [Draconibacterium sp.]
MKTKILILIMLGVFFTNCSVTYLHSSETDMHYPPVKAKTVEVYSMEVANRPYTVIGEVVASADVLGNGSTSVKYLKKEAAGLGADGIINLRLEIGSGILANAVTASGTAVKFAELVNN